MRIETLEIGKPFRIIELLGVAVKVLFVSSETYPLAKTGGLANVSAALPKAVARLGVIFVSLSPATRCALRVASEQRPETKLDLPDAALTQLISAYLPDSGFPVWIVESPSLFRREGGLYRDLDGRDWGDNAQRFAYLTRVAARIAVGRVIPGCRVDVVRCNN
jgi:starch synthase